MIKTLSILILDNFDSFTYNLVDYFEQAGINSKVLRNNVHLNEITAHPYSAIVLSPGPSNPDNSGNLLQVIDYYHKTHPILGICLGCQALGKYFGSPISTLHKPTHGKISTIKIKNDPVFKNLKKSFRVVRYHSLIIKKINSPLQELARTKDNVIMALKHKTLPIYGLQFHPEAALTDNGLDILKNWISLNKLAD